MGEADILAVLQAACGSDDAWNHLSPLLEDDDLGVHLAVMVEPYLTYLLSGEKIIESRFSKNAIIPYQRIGMGDVVFLKCGPVLGCFQVSSTHFFELADGDLARIRQGYAEQICAHTDEFWQARADKRYATLIGVDHVSRLPPVPVPKRDMRGWVVVRPGTRPAYRQLQLL